MLIRSRNSKDRYYNGEKKRDKMTNSNIQNPAQKTKDQSINKGNSKITELWTILQRQSKNS